MDQLNISKIKKVSDDQARDIYKKVQSEDIVNIYTIKQEIEADKLGSDSVDEDKINPYHEIITNKVEEENIITSQMEQCSILSNVVDYVQYERHPKHFYDLDIRPIFQKTQKKI